MGHQLPAPSPAMGQERLHEEGQSRWGVHEPRQATASQKEADRWKAIDATLIRSLAHVSTPSLYSGEDCVGHSLVGQVPTSTVCLLLSL